MFAVARNRAAEMNEMIRAWEKWTRTVEHGIAVWTIVKAPQLLAWLNRLFA